MLDTINEKGFAYVVAEIGDREIVGENFFDRLIRLKEQ